MDLTLSLTVGNFLTKTLVEHGWRQSSCVWIHQNRKVSIYPCPSPFHKSCMHVLNKIPSGSWADVVNRGDIHAFEKRVTDCILGWFETRIAHLGRISAHLTRFQTHFVACDDAWVTLVIWEATSDAMRSCFSCKVCSFVVLSQGTCSTHYSVELSMHAGLHDHWELLGAVRNVSADDTLLSSLNAHCTWAWSKSSIHKMFFLAAFTKGMILSL